MTYVVCPIKNTQLPMLKGMIPQLIVNVEFSKLVFLVIHSYFQIKYLKAVYLILVVTTVV